MALILKSCNDNLSDLQLLIGRDNPTIHIVCGIGSAFIPSYQIIAFAHIMGMVLHITHLFLIHLVGFQIIVGYNNSHYENEHVL